ncbi:helix-turn-helix transcriptional regulator [Veillonella sp.]|uniref:helix-turn-helix transcriptional regulator n=1 Tax=Veillonella sp. TaxID=1926307 RepID=UPI0025CE7253|nr:helix-turn-helix transcriptional regulator [Veillonella sp.]
MNNSTNKKIMSNNIQYYMERFGIDRIKICNDLNIKYTTFVDWLNAKTYPRIDKIESMANYFGIQKSDLVEPKELNNNQIIGNKIKSLRLKNNMTLYSLSQKINLSESTIQRYENGLINSISLDVINKFANAFNISATYFLENNKKDISKLKSLRLKAGLSLTYVAQKTNTTRQTIYKYENKIIENIPYSKVKILAELYNTTPHFILNSNTSNISKTEIIEELLNDVSDDDFNLIVDLIKVVKNRNNI